MSNESILERRLSRIFAEGRQFIEHEDDLVDRRLKWVITVSGFLFAAYGATWIAWPKNFPSDVGVMALTLCFVRLALSVLGIISAKIAAPSIHAAHLAIRAITRKYNSFLEVNERQIGIENLQVWKMIGDRVTHLPGFKSSLFLPYGICMIWVWIAVIDVCLLGYIIQASFDGYQVFFLGYLGSAVLGGLCYSHVLLGAAKDDLASLKYAGKESASVKALLELGEVHNATVISHFSFRKRLISDDVSIEDLDGNTHGEDHV